MKQMLSDYGIFQSTFLIYYDNIRAIDILKYPVQLSRSKHIDIWHHFIRDLVEGKVLALTLVPIEKQLVDIFSKALDKRRYKSLQWSIGLYGIN